MVLLGDCEELWEQAFDEVEAAYRETLQLEGAFPAARYYRVWGNHDDLWMVPDLVERHLSPYMPRPVVHEGLRLDVSDGGHPLGTVLLVHGHQGRFASDRIRPLSRWAVRLWRPIQRTLGVGLTTPATNACYRAEHDREMYEWAVGRPRTILIAGHTHRPVWSSTTHLQKLQRALAEAERDGPAGAPALRRLHEAVRRRRAHFPPCGETLKTLPAYFNTGCCKFADGDITGIELENGKLRLVRWSRPTDGKSAQRACLEEDALHDILGRLDPRRATGPAAGRVPGTRPSQTDPEET